MTELTTLAGMPGRVLPDGRQAVIVPLLFGRARICVGPQASPCWDVAY